VTAVDIRDEVQAQFLALFGYEPAGQWSAPGRVNLIGEHTDYNLGYVLPFAINRRTFVSLGLREDRIIRVASSFADEVVEIPLAELSPGALYGWSAYPLGVAWALSEHGADLNAVPGVDIFIESDVPVGAGLSSSAAIESAIAIALNDVWRLTLPRQVLAQVGQRAENVAVGAPTGIMDQSASLLGQKDCAVFLDCRSSTGGYAERRASCELGARMLGVESLRDVTVADLPRARGVLDDVTFRRVRHVVTENQRVLDTVDVLRDLGPAGIGDLLDASHRSMRDDFEISVRELDLAVETAQSHGAIGARMTGGGFGGAAIALIRSDELSRLRVAIDGAFAEHGFGQPDTFVVTAAQGASRES
jgi:galactokinase